MTEEAKGKVRTKADLTQEEMQELIGDCLLGRTSRLWGPGYNEFKNDVRADLVAKQKKGIGVDMVD